MGMKIRFGVGLGVNTRSDQLAPHCRSHGDQRRGLAVVLRAGLLTSGGSRGRHGVCAGPDGPVEGGHFGGGAAGASSGVGGQTTGIAGSSRAQAGSSRLRLCARPLRPSAKCSPSRTASAQRCSTSRCGCCVQHWSTISASYSGRYFTVSAAAVAPRPVPPLDIWLGGSAPAAFHRIGTLADGWLGSFLTPSEARAGREAIERAAAQAGRHIEPDHFGISLAVADGELPAELVAAVRRRRPDVDPAELVAADWEQLHRQIDALPGRRFDEIRYPAGRYSAGRRLHRPVRRRAGRSAELTG